MKNKIIIAASVVGLLTLGIVDLIARMAPAAYLMWVFYFGFLVAFVTTVIAAASLARHWREGLLTGRLGQFIWCFAVLGGYAGLLLYGP
jgi:hypothetical protein